MQNQNKKHTKGIPGKEEKLNHVDYTECTEKSANVYLMTTFLADTRQN